MLQKKRIRDNGYVTAKITSKDKSDMPEFKFDDNLVNLRHLKASLNDGKEELTIEPTEKR